MGRVHIRRSHFGKKPSNWLAVAALILCAQGALRLLYSKADEGSAKQAKFSREENLFFPRMIWSSPSGPMAPETTRVREELGEQQMNQLRDLCGRTLYHGILNVVVSHNFGRYAFFSTGDLPLMWIRDSAFQIGSLIPRIDRRPALRSIVEGGIRLQAFYIIQDPYANGFYPEWRDPEKENEEDKMLGRGGWVGVRNYELDSGGFYLSLLWDYYTSGQYGVRFLLEDPIIFDAVNTLIDTWIVEQRHNESSPYRFVELPNNGLGREVGYTGMIWSGFRPSDDANMYGYSIPSNMLVAAGIEKALVLNKNVWKSEDLNTKMSELLHQVETGIQQYGIVEVEKGVKVYAYEVDGLGNFLADFDDPNWPSIVSIPLLGWKKYDHNIYQITKSRILSQKNRYFFKGKFLSGLGSPHTATGMIWALGAFSEALTAETAEEKVKTIQTLLQLQCSDGLMHESIHVDNPSKCTRRWFEWANALLVTTAEHLTGIDCDKSAEKLYRLSLAKKGNHRIAEEDLPLENEQSGGAHRQGIEARVQHGGKYVSKVEDWKGIGWTI